MASVSVSAQASSRNLPAKCYKREFVVIRGQENNPVIRNRTKLVNVPMNFRELMNEGIDASECSGELDFDGKLVNAVQVYEGNDNCRDCSLSHSPNDGVFDVQDYLVKVKDVEGGSAAQKLRLDELNEYPVGRIIFANKLSNDNSKESSKSSTLTFLNHRDTLGVAAHQMFDEFGNARNGAKKGEPWWTGVLVEYSFYQIIDGEIKVAKIRRAVVWGETLSEDPYKTETSKDFAALKIEAPLDFLNSDGESYVKPYIAKKFEEVAHLVQDQKSKAFLVSYHLRRRTDKKTGKQKFKFRKKINRSVSITKGVNKGGQNVLFHNASTSKGSSGALFSLPFEGKKIAFAYHSGGGAYYSKLNEAGEIKQEHIDLIERVHRSQP